MSALLEFKRYVWGRANEFNHEAARELLKEINDCYKGQLRLACKVMHLSAKLEKLESNSEVARLRKGLEFYANGHHLKREVASDEVTCVDNGQTARMYLGTTK